MTRLAIMAFHVTPVAWQRVVPFRGARMITAEETREFQRTIGALARNKMGPQKPFDQPLVAKIRFYLPRGRYTTRPHMDVRPDLDNLSKSVLDALNKIVWVDDCRITHLETSKAWTSGAGHLELEVFSV